MYFHFEELLTSAIVGLVFTLIPTKICTVINYTGHRIDCIWNDKNRNLILDSILETIRAIDAALLALPEDQCPSTFIQVASLPFELDSTANN